VSMTHNTRISECRRRWPAVSGMAVFAAVLAACGGSGGSSPGASAAQSSAQATSARPTSTRTSPCTSQAFLKVVKGSGSIQPTISGPPTCVDGYALQTFTAGPGGQAAQFFFKQAQNGSWTLIEGGDAISSIACQEIPAKVLKRLGALCPRAAYSSPS
jgi:hypothetical protein